MLKYVNTWYKPQSNLHIMHQKYSSKTCVSADISQTLNQLVLNSVIYIYCDVCKAMGCSLIRW